MLLDLLGRDTLSRLGRTPRRPSKRPPLLLEALEDRCCPSVNFVFDYSHDTSGFFNSPQARAVLQQAAQIVGSQLGDSLAAISPSGGNTWTASFNDPSTGTPDSVYNLSIGANTIYVFAGGRNYGGNTLGDGGFGGWNASGSQDWINTVGARGQGGALSATPTDFGPWGGAVSFDTTVNWSFGGTSSPPGSNQYDFLSVAEHELGHILGLGTAPSWHALVWNNQFHGGNATNSYGSNPPVTSDGGHWAPGTMSGGHEATMTPSIALGQQKPFSPLDFAALQDVGWQVGASSSPGAPSAPGAPGAPGQPPAAAPSFQHTAGIFDPGSGVWYLHTTTAAGTVNLNPFAFGGPNWDPVLGDWDGNGTATVGVYDPATATWYLRNSNSPGAPDIVIQYGAPGWLPVVGDWAGSGHTGIGVYDPMSGTWYLRNSASSGAPNEVFQYGAPGWLPVAGDWTGSGHTGIGVYNPMTGTWYLRNAASAGAPDFQPFSYGGMGWTPIVGDWGNDGRDTIGVFNPTLALWYLRTSNGPGAPNIAPYAYGGMGWKPVSGDGRTYGFGGTAAAEMATPAFHAEMAASPWDTAPDANLTAVLEGVSDKVFGKPLALDPYGTIDM